MSALLMLAALAVADAPAWKTAHTAKLGGVTVTVSEPVLVARSKSYLWFPGLARAADGKLLAVMTDYADVDTVDSTGQFTWSADGGLTWSKPTQRPYGECPLLRANGDLQLLPYYMHPTKDGIGGAYQLAKKGETSIQLVEPGLTVTGWPRPPAMLAGKHNRSSFVFNGQTVALKDGGHLATLYGHYQGDKVYSLVAAESKDGVAWKVRSLIADKDAGFGGEGPCESAVARLKDGRLMCVFRNAGYKPMGQTFSRDDGKTWDKPVLMKDVLSVQPSVVVLKDGTVVLSSGRPGIGVWVNRDGTAAAWEKIDVEAIHNAAKPTEAIKGPERTSSYTELVATGEKTLLLIYDRIPNGWRAIPKESAETNSVWVVRLVLGKAE